MPFSQQYNLRLFVCLMLIIQAFQQILSLIYSLIESYITVSYTTAFKLYHKYKILQLILSIIFNQPKNLLMQKPNDEMISESLMNQRRVQILRQGVYLTFYRGINGYPSYLQYNFSYNYNFPKFQDIFKSIKYHLDVFDTQLNEIITISRDQYEINLNSSNSDWRIYLMSEFSDLQNGQVYILAKSNSAIPIHTRFMLQRLDEGIYDQRLQQFFKELHSSSAELEQELRLPYATQKDLNDEQNQAIQKSFTNKFLLIKGPAGTGKTVTISRMVTMMASQGKKIIVGSTSDVANLTLINKIIEDIDKWNEETFINPEKRKIRMIIHLSLEGLEKFDKKYDRFLLNEQLCDLIMQNQLYQGKERKELMQKIKIMQKIENFDTEFEEVYYDCLQSLMNDTNIAVTTTIHSLNLRSFTKYTPQIGIVDEAATATLGNCYRFLSFGIKRLICIGDQKQLEPFMLEKKDIYNIFHKTMFEIAQKNKSYVVQLKQQYRMHPQIARFANFHVYNGIITNAEITHTENQSDIKFFQQNPTSFIEHQFRQESQFVIQSSISFNHKSKKVLGFAYDDMKIEYFNSRQGSLIMDFVIHVIPLTEWKNTTILTFYKKQMYEIETGLRVFIELNLGGRYQDYGLTVKTVDGYQGGQHHYILISTVRSNPFINNPQFFTQMNRVNVALTRAKKGMVVFGNSETLKQQKIPQKGRNENIWGLFFSFNQQRNRVLDYWSLESIMNKKNKERGGIYDANKLRSELYQILERLTQPQTGLKQMKKHDKSLSDKNIEIEQEVKQMTKWLKNLSEKDIKNSKDKNIINKFLADQQKRRSNRRYVEKKPKKEAVKPMRETLTEFIISYCTINEISEVIEFIRAILVQVERILIKSNEQLAETIVADSLSDIISCEVNVKRQKIHDECYKMAVLVRNEPKEEKNKAESRWISRKVMMKFANLFDKLIQPTFQYVAYSPTRYSTNQY